MDNKKHRRSIFPYFSITVKIALDKYLFMEYNTRKKVDCSRQGRGPRCKIRPYFNGHRRA